MRAPALLALTFLLGGCVPHVQSYYVPIAESGVNIRECLSGMGPKAQHSQSFGEGVRAFTYVDLASARTPRVLYNFRLDHGSTLKFEGASLFLQTSDSPGRREIQLPRLRASIVGSKGRPGVFEYFEPTSEVKGASRNAHVGWTHDQLILEVALPALVEEFSITLPALVVNRVAFEPQTLRFQLRRQPAVAILCE